MRKPLAVITLSSLLLAFLISLAYANSYMTGFPDTVLPSTGSLSPRDLPWNAPTASSAAVSNITAPYDWYRYQGEEDAPNLYCGEACVAMAIQFAHNNQQVPISAIVDEVGHDGDTSPGELLAALESWTVLRTPISSGDMNAVRQAIVERGHIVIVPIMLDVLTKGWDFPPEPEYYWEDCRETVWGDHHTHRYYDYYVETTRLHWVVAKGISADQEWVIVYDPNVFNSQYAEDTRAKCYWYQDSWPKGKERYYSYSEFAVAFSNANARAIEILEVPGSTCPAPNLVRPEHDFSSPGDTVTFQWDPVDCTDQDGYLLRIGTSPGGSNVVSDHLSLGLQTNVAIDSQWYYQDLYWSVRANASGAQWSGSRPFRVEPDQHVDCSGCSSYVTNLAFSPDSPSDATVVSIDVGIQTSFPNFRAARIRFRDGDTICEGTSFSFSCTWDTRNTPDGERCIVLEIDDNLGASWDNPETCYHPYRLDPRPTSPLPLTGSWHVEYFNDQNLDSPCYEGDESGIYVFKDWGEDAPANGCLQDHWSARFTRRVHFESGTYHFGLGSDDWGRIKIGSDTVVDNWEGAGQHYESTSDPLSEDDYDVTVEFADTEGNARLAAWWWGPGFDMPQQSRDIYQWYAQYWGNADLWWDSIIRVNEGAADSLTHSWGDGGPGFGLPNDHFSSRFERKVRLACGKWHFHILTDDGVRFWIDGEQKLNEWSPGVNSYDVPDDLVAGYHDLKVEHYEDEGGASINLDWSPESYCIPLSPTLQLPLDGRTFDEGESIHLLWSNTGDTSHEYYGEVSGGPDGTLAFGWQQWNTLYVLDSQLAGYTYSWRVKGRNGNIDSGWSDTRTFTIRPAAPSSLSAQADSWHQVTLQWNDNSSNEEGYKIYRDDSYIDQVGAGSTSYEDTGLSPSTFHSYYVEAFRGSIESDPSNLASTTTSSCPAPVLRTPPYNANVTEGSFDFGWEPSDCGNGHRYQIRVLGPSPGFPVVVADTVHEGEQIHENAIDIPNEWLGQQLYWSVRADVEGADWAEDDPTKPGRPIYVSAASSPLQVRLQAVGYGGEPIDDRAQLVVTERDDYYSIPYHNHDIPISDGVSVSDIQLDGVDPGCYDLYLKTLHALRRKKTVCLGGEEVQLIDFTGDGTGPLIAGDANGDNEINIFDFNWCVSTYGCIGPCIADFDLDGDVDIFDFNIVITNFGGIGDGWEGTTLPQSAAEASSRSEPQTLESGAVSVSLDPTQSSLAVGEVVDLAVLLDTGGESTNGSAVILTYDPGVFTVEDSDPGKSGIQTAIGTLYTEYRLNEAHPDDGLIVVSAYNPDEEVFAGQGVFFTARLRAVAALTNTEVTVDFTPGWTVDSVSAEPRGYTNLLGQGDSVSLTVSGSPQRPLPSVAITPASVIGQRKPTVHVDAYDAYDQVQSVQVDAWYDEEWHYVGTDNAIMDGWSVEWDTVDVEDQVVHLRAYAALPGGEFGFGITRYIILDRTAPLYLTHSFYPPSPSPAETVQVSVSASDNLAGVEQIIMYVNEAADGSLDGDWIYAGRVNGPFGVILWDTQEMDNGVHQAAFTIEDRAGNWKRWTGEDPPTILYELQPYQVHLPVVLRSY